MRHLLLVASVLVAIPRPTALAQERGWRAYDLGGGRRATRYVPSAVRLCDPSPLVVFLHGAGGTPEAYHSDLAPPAEELGIVLVLPQSSGTGWSGADTATIEAALSAVIAEGIVVDERRTSLAGHSAGGAFAYLLAYTGSTGFASVFSMSAPYYSVGSISDPMHTAPIRMYYGADDPNFTGGSATMLQEQWTRLGVPHELDVQVGFGHSSWPPSSIRAGLAFLVAHPYPGAPTPTTCGDADAGPVAADASIAVDSGSIGGDASLAIDAGGDLGPAGTGSDSGTVRDRAISSGCACRAAGALARRPALCPSTFALVGLVAVAARRRRRRDAAFPP